MHSLCHDLIPLIFMKIALISANVVPCVYVLWYDLITLCVPTVQMTALPLALPPRLRHDYHPTLAALIGFIVISAFRDLGLSDLGLFW